MLGTAIYLLVPRSAIRNFDSFLSTGTLSIPFFSTAKGNLETGRWILQQLRAAYHI